MSIESEAAALKSQSLRFMEDRAAGWSLRAKMQIGIGVLALLGALAFAFWPAKPIHEDTSAAPMVRISASAVQAATQPDAQPAPAAIKLPRGAVRERAGRIVARPAPGASSVQIDTELVREGDKRKLYVTSPDGTIDTAVDIPIEPAMIPPPPKPWAAGLSYDTRRAVGIWVDRDIGRLVVGAAAARLPDGKVEAQVRVGVRF